MITVFTGALPFIWIALSLAAAAPGMVGGDAPELTAAAFHLGSAHAPGYPLFVTLGRLAQLLPLGSPAFRMTFLSILAQTAALMVLVPTLGKFAGSSNTPTGKNSLVLLAAGLVMAGPLVFHQMVSPEVFALHLFFTAGLLNFVLFPTTFNLYAAGFLTGAALSHQHLTFLILPALGWAYRNELKDGKKAAIASSLLCLGLSPYLVLPLRANLAPLVIWGNPSTFQQLFYHVTRAQYGGDISTGSFLNGFWDLYLYTKDFLLESWGLGPVLLAAGLWKNRKGIQPEYFIGASCLFILLPFLIRDDYNPENNHINGAFLPPALLWFSPLILRGLEWIFARRGSWKPLLIPAAALILCGSTLSAFTQNNSSRNLAVEDVGLDILSQMPAHSVLFSSGDSITFPLAYLKLVRHLRPDLDIFDRTGGLFPDIYHLLDYRNETGTAPPLLAAAERNYEARQNPSAVFYSEKIDAPRETLLMKGLLFWEAYGGHPPPAEEFLWQNFRTPRVELNHDYLSRETASRYYLFKASYGLEVAKSGFMGEDCLMQAKAIGFDNSRLFLNAGVVENSQGWTDHAALSFEKASQLSPGYFLPWFDRGILAENQKNPKDALQFFRKAVKLNPSSTDAHQHLGFQYFQAGLFEQATKEWETVRSLDPNYAEAYRTLGYMNMRTRADYAAQMFERYLLLVPNPPDKATITDFLASQPHI